MKALHVTIFLFSLLALGIFLSYIFLGLHYGVSYDYDPHPNPYQEKMTVLSASYNSTSNSIFLCVQATNDLAKNATLYCLIIKNSSGSVVGTPLYLSNNLTGFELREITAPLNSTLTSGTYYVNLETTRGAVFASPPINVP